MKPWPSPGWRDQLYLLGSLTPRCSCTIYMIKNFDEFCIILPYSCNIHSCLKVTALSSERRGGLVRSRLDWSYVLKISRFWSFVLAVALQLFWLQLGILMFRHWSLLGGKFQRLNYFRFPLHFVVFRCVFSSACVHCSSPLRSCHGTLQCSSHTWTSRNFRGTPVTCHK